eukprot:scaffold75680_cov21-Phaeocystis_antarctica.AAC.1
MGLRGEVRAGGHAMRGEVRAGRRWGCGWGSDKGSAPRDLLRHSVQRRVPEVHSLLSRVRAGARARVRLMDRARRKARAGLMARARGRSRASSLLGRGAAVGRSEDWRDPVYGLDLG